MATYTGHTQNNGAVSIVFTIETAPFFYVYPVLVPLHNSKGVLERRGTDPLDGYSGLHPAGEVSKVAGA
jgi:hypothetical protein